MAKQDIKVIFSAIWSIVNMPGIRMTNAGQAEPNKNLTGDIKLDLTFQKGNEHERENGR